MRVSIDKTSCISCKQCSEICPEVFRPGKDDISEVHTQPTAETEDAARQAADECPVSAIIIEE